VMLDEGTVTKLVRGKIQVGNRAVPLNVSETLSQIMAFSHRFFAAAKKETKGSPTSNQYPYKVELRSYVEDLPPNEPIA
jgi:hypothetical protein